MDEKFCGLVVKRYELKEGTKNAWKETETEQERSITEQEYNNIVDASPFFRRLGGSEYQEKGYTSKGYNTVKIISKSPNRTQKTIRWFIFDNEYPLELIKCGIGDYKCNLKD